MKRLAGALAILAACGAPPPHGPATRPVVTPGDAVPPPEPPPPSPPPPPKVIRATTLRPVIEAPHAGAVVTLAITLDGTAALSSDELGGVRLWPKLDGSVEPRLVDLPVARTLALSPRDTGFTAVALDGVGGLYVANLDADGRTRSHAVLAAEPAFTGIAATPTGTLAWRVDQTLALLDDDGATRSRVAVEAGQRLVDVALAGTRALVLLESGGTRRARWLELAPALAWGAWIDPWQDLGQAIAVSPGGARVAIVRRDENQPARVVAIELATGKTLGEAQISADIELGFLDEDHVGYGGSAGVGWLALDASAVKATPPRGAGNPGVSQAHPVFAIAGGHAVAAAPGGLMIATPTTTQYLGYALGSPSVAAPAADARLLIGLAGTFALLDRDLRMVAAPTLAIPAGSTAAELRWLGGDDWAVEVTEVATGRTSLQLVDAAHGTSQVARADMKTIYVLAHEPSTHLVTLSLADRPEIHRYDPARHRLERIAALPSTRAYEQTELVPVSPALAGGAQLVRVTMRERTTIQWLADPRAVDKPMASVTSPGSFAGVDAAGHVYLWGPQAGGPLELEVYGAGKRLGTLPTSGAVALWPDPRGERVVEVGLHDVALYKVDGTRLWVQELAGTQEAMWLSDGTIAITSAAGIARLDPATGQVQAARCGWRFGLSATPYPQAARIEPLCAQLDR